MGLERVATASSVRRRKQAGPVMQSLEIAHTTVGRDRRLDGYGNSPPGWYVVRGVTRVVVLKTVRRSRGLVLVATASSGQRRKGAVPVMQSWKNDHTTVGRDRRLVGYGKDPPVW
jgi:hypothetical protein